MASESRNGARLRGGLPESNGIAPLADELVSHTDRLIWIGGCIRVAAVTHNVEADSRTASMKIITLEADFTDEEQLALQTIVDRARVRRTNEVPLFSAEEMAAAEAGVEVRFLKPPNRRKR